MSSALDSEIDAALSGNQPIPKEKVLAWVENASELLTLSKLYRLTDQAYYRIRPELGMDATCGLIQHYLLECIKQNIEGNDEIQSRFDACQTLHVWFCHLSEMEGTSPVLTRAVRALTDLFLARDDTQYTIETTFLEHALEMTELRPYFEFWETDDRLRPAWERAMEWGESHPNFVWGMIQRRSARKD